MSLHWLPISFRINFKIALLVYKAINGMAPSYLTDLILLKHNNKYSLRSSNELLLTYPLRKSYITLGDRSFSMAAPKIWNSLPINVKSATSVETFKRLLKTYYFKLAFL